MTNNETQLIVDGRKLRDANKWKVKIKIKIVMHTYKEIKTKEMVVIECYQTMVMEGMMAWSWMPLSKKQ